MHNDEITSIVYRYPNLQGHGISKRRLQSRLSSHPDYPHFIAITDTLEEFDIPNGAFHIATDQLPVVAEPFIAAISKDAVPQLVLVKPEKAGYTVFDGSGKESALTAAELAQIWTGNIIAIDKNPSPYFTQWQWKSEYAYVLAAILYTSLLAVTQAVFNGWQAGFVTASMVGVAISIVLLRAEAGRSTAITQKFCQLSNHSNCQTVLQSKAAKLYKHIGLADVALVYFGTQLLAIFNEHTWWLLGLISLLALAATLYTLYQQKVVLRTWCPLCLGITAVLWLQAGMSWPLMQAMPATIDANIAIPIMLAYFLMAAWWHAKQWWLALNANETLLTDNLRFRRNYHLFLPWYQQQPVLSTRMSRALPLRQGPPNAPITITLLTNPLCEACYMAHKTVSQLMERYPDEIGGEVVFYTPAATLQDPRTQIAAWLYYQGTQLPAGQQWQPLHSWYQQPDLKRFDALRWPVAKVAAVQPALLQQRQWADAHQLKRTPTLLTNGRIFPDYYHTEDLTHFITPLLQHIQQSSMTATQIGIGQYT